MSVFRLGLAALLGGIIGIERQFREREAGSAHAHARRCRRGALHGRLGLRLPRRSRERKRRDRPARSVADRGRTVVSGYRLPRRRRNHPTGSADPRLDDARRRCGRVAAIGDGFRRRPLQTPRSSRHLRRCSACSGRCRLVGRVVNGATHVHIGWMSRRSTAAGSRRLRRRERSSSSRGPIGVVRVGARTSATCRGRSSHLPRGGHALPSRVQALWRRRDGIRGCILARTSETRGAPCGAPRSTLGRASATCRATC